VGDVRGSASPRDGARTPSFGRWLAQVVALLAVAVVLALGIRTFAVQPFFIPSASMEDTLLIGDRVLVNMSAYLYEEPKRGDIVVFVSSADASVDMIKRVVAIGGQTVDIRDGAVYVDGERLAEQYVNARYPDHYYANSPVTVPEGMVYVMGDNRANSTDSRYTGPQPMSAILGRAFAIYWPVARLRLL
jgi:signal peptidase I